MLILQIPLILYARHELIGLAVGYIIALFVLSYIRFLGSLLWYPMLGMILLLLIASCFPILVYLTVSFFIACVIYMWTSTSKTLFAKIKFTVAVIVMIVYIGGIFIV